MDLLFGLVLEGFDFAFELPNFFFDVFLSFESGQNSLSLFNLFLQISGLLL